MAETEAQLKALAITPKVTSAISIPCSVFIVKEVIADHRRQRGKATLRALLGMSVIDILASSGWFLSTWAAPVGSNAIYAVGNTQSCTYQGFLLQIAIGAPLYNGALALYYLLTIRYGWQEQDLRRIEPYIHAVILLFTFGTGLLLIPLDVYNHIGTVCWAMGLPQGCGNSNHTPSDVPCERGNHAWIYGLVLFYGPLWVCIVSTTVAMVMIYKKVRETEKRNLRYAGAQGEPRRRTFLMSDRIATQALLYTIAFYITWLPSTLWSVTTWFDNPMFWLDLLACICEPSQGTLNLVVFLRPRPALRARLYNQFCWCCQWKSNDPGTAMELTDHSSCSRRSGLRRMTSDVRLSHHELADEIGHHEKQRPSFTPTEESGINENGCGEAQDKGNDISEIHHVCFNDGGESDSHENEHTGQQSIDVSSRNLQDNRHLEEQECGECESRNP